MGSIGPGQPCETAGQHSFGLRAGLPRLYDDGVFKAGFAPVFRTQRFEFRVDGEGLG
jgi:hypothetical protein